MGSVNISLANGQTGAALQTNDGICGLVLTGAGSADVLSPMLFTSLKAAETAGITLADEPFAYRQIKDFYTMAGTGSQLYVMLVAGDYNIGNICSQGSVNSVELLLNYAQGKIRMLGVMTDDAAVAALDDPTTITGGLNALVYTAITNLDVIAQAYFEAQKPFRAVIGGTSYNGTSGDLTDLTTYTKNRIAVLLGDTVSGIQACLGLLLGKLATLPVQRKISRVKDGSLPIVDAFLGTENMNALTSIGDPAVIAGKGFITFATYANLAGYFFSSDPTASSTTDDYHPIVHGRVIDKAQIITYVTFVNEVDDEIPTIAGGKPEPAWCAALENKMKQALTVTMLENKEISGITVYINPEQNVVATDVLNVAVSLRPVAYATDINVVLGFTLG